MEFHTHIENLEGKEGISPEIQKKSIDAVDKIRPIDGYEFTTFLIA